MFIVLIGFMGAGVVCLSCWSCSIWLISMPGIVGCWAWAEPRSARKNRAAGTRRGIANSSPEELRGRQAAHEGAAGRQGALERNQIRSAMRGGKGGDPAIWAGDGTAAAKSAWGICNSMKEEETAGCFKLGEVQQPRPVDDGWCSTSWLVAAPVPASGHDRKRKMRMIAAA